MKWVFIRICPLILLAGALPAQHGFTPADIEDGGKLFLANCIGCHGAEGNMVQGVDLAHGKFRRASTDQDLVNIVRTGIAGTAMPPGNYTEFQAGTIVAYLRSLAATGLGSGIAGDAARGKTLFAGKGNCGSCHRVNTSGSRVGPDLTDVGTLRNAASLERSLTDPDFEVLAQNRYYRAVTKDGAVVEGRLLNRDTFSVQLLDMQEKIRSFQLADLKEYGVFKKSAMPSYKDQLSSQEIADLVSYLGSLKGVEVQ